MKTVIVLALLLSSSFVVMATPSAHEMVPVPQPVRQYDKLIDLYKSLDVALLESKDEERIAKYLAGKNAEMIKYLVTKYPEFGPADMVDIKSPAATWMGLNYALYEANGFKPLAPQQTEEMARQIPGWLSCTLGVLGSAVGITEAIAGLGNFSVGSVWGIVKTVVKKYALGWLGTAVALVEIAHECF